MPPNRSAGRNVHFYEARTGLFLGGFRQNGSITEDKLINILSSILLVVQGEYPIAVRHRSSSRTIQPSSDRVVEFGEYDIYAEGIMAVFYPYMPEVVLS